jgi:hypothetical protein
MIKSKFKREIPSFSRPNGLPITRVERSEAGGSVFLGWDSWPITSLVVKSKNDEHDANRQCDISDIEDSGAQWADTNVHEVDDTTSSDPINEIRCAAGDK